MLFNTYQWTSAHRETFDCDGHIVFPGLLTDDAQERLTTSLSKIHKTPRSTGPVPKPTNMYAAEYDPYLESVIAHPQMLELARHALGENIRYDY